MVEEFVPVVFVAELLVLVSECCTVAFLVEPRVQALAVQVPVLVARVLSQEVYNPSAFLAQQALPQVHLQVLPQTLALQIQSKSFSTTESMPDTYFLFSSYKTVPVAAIPRIVWSFGALFGHLRNDPDRLPCFV